MIHFCWHCWSRFRWIFFSVEGIERETEATTEAKSNEERPWSRVRLSCFRSENLIIEQFTFLPTYYRVEYLIYFLILFLFFQGTNRKVSGKYQFCSRFLDIIEIYYFSQKLECTLNTSGGRTPGLMKTGRNSMKG